MAAAVSDLYYDPYDFEIDTDDADGDVDSIDDDAPTIYHLARPLPQSAQV